MVLPSFLLVDVVLLTMDVPLFVISLSYLTVVISHTQLPSFNVLDPLSPSRSNIPVMKIFLGDEVGGGKIFSSPLDVLLLGS